LPEAVEGAINLIPKLLAHCCLLFFGIRERGFHMLKREELSTWLFENGGPVIRYRTATELLSQNASLDIRRLTGEMLQSPQVRLWLERLIRPRLLNSSTTTLTVQTSGINQIHNSKPTALENALAKLADFGLKKGMPELDRRILPYRKWMKDNAKRLSTNVYNKFGLALAAAFLARAGYMHEPAVQYLLKRRLDMVHDFARKGDYDIYTHPRKYLRKLPMIKLELTPNGDCYLPLIYDIVGWAAYLPACGTKEELAKADTIISYILREEYQKFPWGYGIMGDGTGRTWSLGWSVYLERYKGAPARKNPHRSVVHTISLLINFQAARKHGWFKESLDHLEKFRTGEGTYRFPPEYLQGKTVGYWVNGVHMGLEGNHRTDRALELESTFWMAKFHTQLETT
jgi:hypothetical protein